MMTSSSELSSKVDEASVKGNSSTASWNSDSGCLDMGLIEGLVVC